VKKYKITGTAKAYVIASGEDADSAMDNAAKGGAYIKVKLEKDHGFEVDDYGHPEEITN